jgi:hypothetical protein
MKRTLSILSVLSLLVPALPARADINIDPLLIEAEVPAGGSYSRTIAIQNPRKTPMELSTQLMDWKYIAPSGKKTLLQAGLTARSCARWVTLTPDKLTIPPGGIGTLRFSLTTPKEAEGGYVATILYRINPPPVDKDNPNTTVNIGVQLTAPILLEIAKTQRVEGTLMAFQPVNPKANRPMDVKAKFRNTGNVRIQAKGRLAIMDMKGKALGWTPFPDLKTLPGDEFEVTASWKAGLPPGDYRLVATFEMAPGKILVEEKTVKLE